ncbi:tip elongation aberrant protein 1-like isoform X2 [Lotus japonicus]|nr:tip elongation aberrant protein 1-like isoform X2 [Lotus japonicus]
MPQGREDHGAAFVGKRLFIFGGFGKSPENINDFCYNDLYILDTETFVWTRPTTLGTPPCPRHGHTCSSWEKNIVVIGGGVDELDKYVSDVHILDTDTLIWRELHTSGKVLPPRAGHSTVSFGKNLFVFGGVTSAQSLYNDLYMLDIDTGIWTEVATTCIGPSARYSAAGDRLDFMGGILVFFGGCNKDALDDMYYLYTGRLNIDPGKRACQVKVTGSNSYGYTIETIIDGKRFHGILFRDKPNPLNPATNTSSRRKRTFDETVSVFSNDMHRDNLTMSKVLKQSGTGDRWEVQGDVSASETLKCDSSDDSLGLPPGLLGLCLTKSPSLLALIQTTLSQQHDSRKASADPEPAAASLNRNDNERNDKSKNDGANDNMTRSEVEVRTDDQTNVPISNNEAPRLERHDQKSDAAAAEGGIAKDCTTRRVEDTENQQI